MKKQQIFILIILIISLLGISCKNKLEGEVEINTENNVTKYLLGTKIKLSYTIDDATIYYTLDGSKVTKNSNKYTEPFPINNDVIVTAVAINKKGLKSKPNSKKYMIARVSDDIKINGLPITDEIKILNEETTFSIECTEGEVYVKDKTGVFQKKDFFIEDGNNSNFKYKVTVKAKKEGYIDSNELTQTYSFRVSKPIVRTSDLRSNGLNVFPGEEIIVEAAHSNSFIKGYIENSEGNYVIIDSDDSQNFKYKVPNNATGEIKIKYYSYRGCCNYLNYPWNIEGLSSNSYENYIQDITPTVFSVKQTLSVPVLKNRDDGAEIEDYDKILTTDEFVLSKSSQEGKIYYTTDGSIPTKQNGNIFNGEKLKFAKDTYLRAITIGNDGTITSSLLNIHIKIKRLNPVLIGKGEPNQFDGEADITLSYEKVESENPKIYYSINGGESYEGTTASISLSEDNKEVTIKAEARLNGYITSVSQKKYYYKDNIVSVYPQDREELINIINTRINTDPRNLSPDLNDIDISKVDDLSNLFMRQNEYNSNALDLQYRECPTPKIDKWDTSKATNMVNMFYNNTEFNGDISKWDVSNVTNMYNMFRGATNFNADISNWDVSSVIYMANMFSEATNFNADISNWDVRNVVEVVSIFSNAVAFNQSLNNWRLESATSLSGMFIGAINFNQSLNEWDVSNVTDMSGMFFCATSFNQDINEWDVSNVTNMENMFNQAVEFNQPLNNWNVENVENMISMFAGFYHSDENIHIDVKTKFNQDISMWKPWRLKWANTMFNYSSYSHDLNNWESYLPMDVSGSGMIGQTPTMTQEMLPPKLRN